MTDIEKPEKSGVAGVCRVETEIGNYYWFAKFIHNGKMYSSSFFDKNYSPLDNNTQTELARNHAEKWMMLIREKALTLPPERRFIKEDPPMLVLSRRISKLLELHDLDTVLNVILSAEINENDAKASQQTINNINEKLDCNFG